MASGDTRERILRAALGCFLQDGYEQTTIARIRERSGASNGALFHHFPSKDAIADALYVDAIASFQTGLWELVRSRPRSLRAAVRGTIAHQLEWTEQHPDLARFVYMRGHLEWESSAGTELASLNRDLAAAFREWMKPLVTSGEMRSASILLITAVVGGPAHAIARRWLAGQLAGPPTAFVDQLADAAYAALRGAPVPPRRRPAAAPTKIRVSLEMTSADGTVVGHGESIVALSTEPKELSK
jgi:AcrR family transcriptional regulator